MKNYEIIENTKKMIEQVYFLFKYVNLKQNEKQKKDVCEN